MELTTSFPDPDYIESLLAHLRSKNQSEQTMYDELLMRAGASLNWLGDYLLDSTISWQKVILAVDQLTLTGTKPEWNAIVLDRAERSPKLLRELLADSETAKLFESAIWNETPILVRTENGEQRVLDGMHRAIAAIRDGHSTIEAYVATSPTRPRPVCEPHVIYDLIRAYQRGSTRNQTGLIAALRYLRESYANVSDLLRVRFGPQSVYDDELRTIIAQVLIDEI